MASLIASGCASTTTKYLHPNVDLGAIRRVAVLPFENLTQERTAAEKIHKIFLTELLSAEAFEVVEPGQVTKELRAARIESVEALGPAGALEQAVARDGLAGDGVELDAPVAVPLLAEALGVAVVRDEARDPVASVERRPREQGCLG